MAYLSFTAPFPLPLLLPFTPFQVDSRPRHLKMEEPAPSLADTSPSLSGLPKLEGPEQPIEPPDGGFDAWLQVLGAFIFYIGSW